MKRWKSSNVKYANGLNWDDYYVISIFISGASEYLEDTFIASKFPYDGHCNISPNNGTSLETIFKISCQDWKSSANSLNYRVRLQRQSNEYLLSYGSVPEVNVYLPVGDESNNYMVNITVEVIDLFQASTSFPLYAQVQLSFYLMELRSPYSKGIHTTAWILYYEIRKMFLFNSCAKSFYRRCYCEIFCTKLLLQDQAGW